VDKLGNLNDEVILLRWDRINTVKEMIEPFEVPTTNAKGLSGLTSVIKGTNNSSLPQLVVVRFDRADAQTATVTTTDQRVVGITATCTSESELSREVWKS
jgi:hypothetical protein